MSISSLSKGLLPFLVLSGAVDARCPMKVKQDALSLTNSVDAVHEFCELDAMMCQSNVVILSSFSPPPPPQPKDRNILQLSESKLDDSFLDPMIGKILDDMMDTTMDMSFMSVNTPYISEFQADFDAMDKVFDEMLADFFGAIPEEPEKVIQLVHSHGRDLLSREELEEPRQRLARRLSEVSPPPVKPKTATVFLEQPSLRYGPDTDRCLWERYLQNQMLSRSCSASMKSVKESYYVLSSDYEQLQEDIEAVGFLFSLLGGVLFFISTVFLLRSCFFRKASRKLKHKILNIVYSNPRIKQQIQQSLGEDNPMGDHPFIPHHQNHEEDHSCSVCIDRFCLSLPLLALSALLCYISLTEPGIVLLVGGPVIFIMSVYHIFKSCCRLCFSSAVDMSAEESNTCDPSSYYALIDSEELEEDAAVRNGYPGAVGMAKRNKETSKKAKREEVVVYMAVPAVV